MKKLISLFAALFIIVCIAAPAFAAGGYPKIVDKAGILTSIDEEALESQAQLLVDEYDIDVVILTVESTNGKDITAFADDYFDYNGYGIGSDYSGVALVLAMDERDWAISTCGEAIDALTDYGQAQIMDQVLEYLGNDEYGEGFALYLELLDEYFAAYRNGETIDEPHTLFDTVFELFIALAIGAAAGGITIWIMRSGMKTVRPQSGATDYVQQGTYYLRNQRDIYLYSRTTRRRKESSSSGGSSTHLGSSGRSHGGSRGKF